MGVYKGRTDGISVADRAGVTKKLQNKCTVYLLLEIIINSHHNSHKMRNKQATMEHDTRLQKVKCLRRISTQSRGAR